MGHKSKGKSRNWKILHNARNLEWAISAYEKATSAPKGSIRELAPEQLLQVIGLPVPLLTFEFPQLPTLHITTWHSDLTANGHLFRSSADLEKGSAIKSTTDINRDGSSFTLAGIRDDILKILEPNQAKGAKIITQAAIMNPDGEVEFVLDIDIGLIKDVTYTIDPTRGRKDIRLKTDSIYKRLEGIAGTQLISSSQHFWFEGDTSLDHITPKTQNDASTAQGRFGYKTFGDGRLR